MKGENVTDIEGFYDGHVGKVYKFFYIQCFDRHLAEDLTSQVFVAFMEKTDSVVVQRYTQYLYGIMRNVWTEYLKNKYKENLFYIENIEDFAEFSDEKLSEYDAGTVESRAEKYLLKLPKKQRQVAQMRFLEQRTLKEVADEIGKSVRYVKTTQNRAVKSLRKLMAEPIFGQGGVS